MNEKNINSDIKISLNKNKSVKKRKWLKWSVYSIIIFVFLIILFSLIPYYLHTFKGEDSLPPNDKDLMLYKIEVLKEDNAYFDLIKLSAILDDEDMIDALIEVSISDEIDIMNHLDSYNWDQKLVEDLLEQNMEALEVYSEAASKTFFQYDLTANPAYISYKLPLIGMNSWREVSRLNSIKAIYLMKQGYYEEALDEAMKSVKIGYKIKESKNIPTIVYLIGLAIKNTGLETIQVLVINDSIPQEFLEKYQNELQNYYAKNNYDFFKVEYVFAKESLKDMTDFYFFQDIDKSLLENNYYFKPNQTLGLFADFYRKQTERINTSCEEELTEIKVWNEPSYKMYFIENSVGKLLLSFNSYPSSIRDRKCMAENLLNETINLLK
jgi:tetratricopeptide (TPR) repeat protein